jgi:hypothetical protein
MRQTFLLFVLLFVFTLDFCSANNPFDRWSKIDEDALNEEVMSDITEESPSEAKREDSAKIMQSAMRLFAKFFHLFKDILKDQDLNVLFKSATPVSTVSTPPQQQ